MSVLAESFDNVQPTDLKVEINNLANFLQILQFCEDMKDTEDATVISKDTVAIEENANKAGSIGIEVE